MALKKKNVGSGRQLNSGTFHPMRVRPWWSLFHAQEHILIKDTVVNLLVNFVYKCMHGFVHFGKNENGHNNIMGIEVEQTYVYE